jgi:alpha-ketoglutarate-dependent taurine dioxygenase
MKEHYIWNKDRALQRENSIYIDAGFSTESAQEAISRALAPLVDNEEIFHRTDFQAEVATVLSRALPDVQSVAHAARDRILGDMRFVVVRGLGFMELPEPIRNLYILGFTAHMGIATPTDQVKKKVLWPVKADMSPTVKNLTFSQTLGEAAYHTDTQYFSDPEEMFGLWCLQPDKNGEGISGLVDGRFVVEELSQTPEGQKILTTLMHARFPFRVPSIFTASATDQTVEVFMAPILADKPFIRYRRETLDKGVAATGQELTDDQLAAINYLDQRLRAEDIAYSFLINQGEVAFANNHELLHSRSDFNDPNRHLIRVRMNPHESGVKELQ